MSRRLPRRTRVYDCNYDKGESYYRPALDRLDRKYSGRPLESQTLEDSRPPLADDFLDRTRRAFDGDSDLSSARRRAASSIQEDSVFDSRGAMTSRAGGRPLSVSFDTDPGFADEVNSKLSQMRFNKKKMDAGMYDDMDTVNGALMPPSVLRQRTKFTDNAADRMMESGLTESLDSSSKQSATMKRRVMKITATSERSSDVAEGAKWTALRSSEDEGSAAAQRARQSRALLADIDADLNAAAERQAARERRLVGLRTLIADNERDDREFSAIMTSRKENAAAKMLAC